MKYKSKYSWLIIPEHCRLPFTSKLSYRGHQEVIRGQIEVTSDPMPTDGFMFIRHYERLHCGAKWLAVQTSDYA